MDFFNSGMDPCVVLKDIQRKIVNCNQQFLSFYGKIKEEVLGKTIEELRPDERFAHLYKKYDEMALKGKTFTAYHPGFGVDGRATFYHGITEVLADLDGTITGVKISFYDTGKDNLLSIIPSIEFINGKFECDHANVGKALFEGVFRTVESYVFYYLVRGWAIEAIAKKLDISVSRAQEVKEMVLLKMEVSDVDALFEEAARRDMLCNVPKDLLYKPPKNMLSIDSKSTKKHYQEYGFDIQKIFLMLAKENDPIKSFSYINLYPDNTAVLLSTHPDRIEAGIKDRSSGSFEMIDALAKEKDRGEYFCYTKEHNGRIILMICFHHGEWIEVCCFGVENADVAENMLANEKLRLLSFIHGFLGYAKKIIKSARKNTILLEGRAPLSPVCRTVVGSDMLSPREFEIMELLVRNISVKLIAKQFDISPDTVKGHSKRIKEKLGVFSIGQLSERYWLSSPRKN